MWKAFKITVGVMLGIFFAYILLFAAVGLWIKIDERTSASQAIEQPAAVERPQSVASKTPDMIVLIIGTAGLLFAIYKTAKES